MLGKDQSSSASGAAPKSNDRDPDEARLLLRVRVVIVAVVAALLVFAVIVDTLGRLFVDPSFHVDSLVFGGLLGALMLAGGIGFVTGVRLPGGWEIRRSDFEKADKTKDGTS